MRELPQGLERHLHGKGKPRHGKAHIAILLPEWTYYLPIRSSRVVGGEADCVTDSVGC
jgi:hypothetical protein